jgi:hypothetical protein
MRRRTGTILDDDNAHLSISDVSTTEGNNGQKFLEFTVTLSGSHAEPVTVDYTTIDGTAKSAGTAPRLSRTERDADV